jgi:hypothetical protein
MSNKNFSYFVMFADMRTGSNFLEESINGFPDLKSHGEIFNPHFIGRANAENYLGMSLNARLRNPFEMLERLLSEDRNTLHGFRFFNDHEPRMVDRTLRDPACAKIILTRNPLDSYISRKIASETGQWKLTNVKHKKSVKISFKIDEFDQHLSEIQNFQLEIQRSLQVSGQTAFYINYDDINDVEVINGLATFLGSEHQVEEPKNKLKKQNPGGIDKKVKNPREMTSALASLDLLNLGRTPNFEARRGARVPDYRATAKLPLLYLPVLGGPVEDVVDWMTSHEGAEPMLGLNQKALRQWTKKHEGYASFTVLRHPVLRAYTTLCKGFQAEDHNQLNEVRRILRQVYGVANGKPGEVRSTGEQRAEFLAFLKFLKENIEGQTGVRTHASWASFSATLQGMSQVVMPKRIILEQDAVTSFAEIEKSLSLRSIPINPTIDTAGQVDLAQIYDDEIEAAVRDIYMRDYLGFGFSNWRPL